jgi:DNA-directed RNA polymerase subunit RPC12/RpoP
MRVMKGKRYVSCPRCGTFGLSVLSRRDHIDTISRNPLRRLLGMLNARLYHCRGCRFQFHDLRRRAPLAERKLQVRTENSQYRRPVNIAR